MLAGEAFPVPFHHFGWVDGASLSGLHAAELILHEMGLLRFQHEFSIPSDLLGKAKWETSYWDSLNEEARTAAKLLGFNEEIWDSDSEVPIYSTPFDKLTNDKKEAVVYLGLRSYFK